MNPELKKAYDENQRVKHLIDTSKAVEGLPRHASTHAAGVVISKSPLTEHVPLQKLMMVVLLHSILWGYLKS